MNRSSRIAASAGALVFSVATIAPASAQYENMYVPPKLLVRGNTASAVSGNGTVVVQVQVNADGTHKVIKVIKSSNPADNRAALDIADTSTYRPATRGGKPVTSFYDYTLKFNGKSLAAGGGSQADQIAALNRQGNYAAAKDAATKDLAVHPSDQKVQQQLGIAEFFQKDYTGAAAAFSQAGTIDKSYHALAANAYANAAVALATGDQPNPTQAVTYGQKALALDSGANSYYALGIAQLANKDFANAVTSLSRARQLAFADPKTTTAQKVNLDAALMQAYTSTNDTADANKIRAEIHQLDPNSAAGAQAAAGSQYLTAGVDDDKKGQFEDAVKQYDQAAAGGSPAVQVTAYTRAAFSIAQEQKPDYSRMKSYADKALAIKSDDPLANFAAGVALTGQYAMTHNDVQKQQAQDFLTKASQYAKAANNEALVLQIEAFQKNNMPK